MSNSGTTLRVSVTDLKTGKSKANVSIPLGLADFGLKMAAKFAPQEMQNLDMDQLIAVAKNNGQGKLVEVDDEDKGEHVEVFVE